MKIPEQYNPVMPYLVLNDPAGFIEFIGRVFGAKEQLMVRMPDGVITHSEFRIGEAVIMLAQAGGTFAAFPSAMCLPVDAVDEIYNRAIGQGATSLQEPANREYGRSAGFADAWGNYWWLMNPVAHVV